MTAVDDHQVAAPSGGSRGSRRRRQSADKAPKINLAEPIKKNIRGGLIGTWFIAFINAFFLILVGRVMDQMLLGKPITGIVLFVIAVFVTKRAFMGWSVPVRGAKAQGLLEVNLRDRVYRSVMGQGAVIRSQEQTGRLVATGTQSVELSSTFYATFLGPIIGSMTTPLVVLVVIAIWIDPFSAAVLAALVILIPLTVGLFQRAFQKVSDDYTAQAGRLSASFLDAIQGLPTLVLFNQGRQYGARLAAAAEEVRRSVMKLLAGNQIVLMVVDSVFSLGMVTVAAWLAMTQLRDGDISAGQALSLVLLGLLLIEPLDKVGQFFYVGMSGIAAGRDIRRQLAMPVALPDSDTATAPTDPCDGAIEFEHVCFAYDDSVPVLRDVSFAVPAGSKVALVGPSGSGKTTVTSLLMRFIGPGSGTISIGGHDVADVSAAWVRQQIALVTQGTYLFHGTLRDNLLVADPEASDERLAQAMADADLAEFLNALPAGLDSPVGERGLAVSGGQAQRIAIARAFLKDAPILLLDEPTSNIDAESEAAIVAAIERLSVGRTVLVVAHRLSTVRNVDQVVVLEAGRVIEAGTPAGLMARGGHYAAAVGRSQGAQR